MAASKGSVQEINGVQVDGLVSQSDVCCVLYSVLNDWVSIKLTGGTEGDQTLSGRGQ